MVALYTFLQKNTITDLADLQHLLTCNNNLVFKAGRALHEACQRNCKVIEPDKVNFIHH